MALNPGEGPADKRRMPVEMLERCLRALVDENGSDLHLKAGSPPRIRVNGSLTKLSAEAALTATDVADMAQAIMRDDLRQLFETSNEVDFAYAVEKVGRFRVNAFRQRGTVAMVMRRVRTSAVTLDELGLPEVVRTLASEHRGLLLVTGPTGSGKTTTLAAMIDHINRTRDAHIVTIEDPIEVLHADDRSAINQREIGVDTDSFADAMRAALRQDPDVILVGEMRDPETVAAALSAAETGHLVLSTLHTIDAVETISRIVDFFPPYQQGQVRVALAGSLKGTICQRLMPAFDGLGRVAAFEVMVVNGRVQQCILEPGRGSDLHDIMCEGEYYGMQTFDQSLARLYAAGKIDIRAAMQTASNPHDLRVVLQREGLLVAQPA
jgi:twitching motility protein PilT